MKQKFLNLFTTITFLIATSLILKPQSIFAEEWSEIESRGELKIAVKNNLRPLGFTNQNGKLVGLEIDIAHKLAEELLGNKEAVEFLPVSNKERLQVILKDKVDIAIAQIAFTTPRRRIVDFSPYYYLDGTGIVTKKPEIKNVSSLAHSKIVVLKNSATIAVVRHKLPNAVLIGAESYQEALQLIEAQQAEAFAGDHSILAGWTQEYPTYKLLPERLSGAALGIAMPKGLQYKELRYQVNQAIARWQKTGWLQERIKYWKL